VVAGVRRSSVVIVCTKLEFAMVALNRASGGLSAKRAVRMLQHIRKECAEERFGSAVRTGWGLCDGAWGCSRDWSGWEVGMVSVAAFAVDMLDNMSGTRCDTPLMKAAATGNILMVEAFLRHNARSNQFMAGTGREGRVCG
jgi:hypothetical protein